MELRDIIVLETENNKKGDLFNRMVYDVFHSLGFGESLYNIPRTGREIDIILRHRTESRFALVESKSCAEKIGGADVNKFVGAFEAERYKFEQDGNSAVGYFASLSGFKDTAVAQENERAKEKKKINEKNEILLLGPKEIVRELIQGNVLCSLEKAADAVDKSRCGQLHICGFADLLACDYGWIWLLYYSAHPEQAATHFSFVHADGNRLLNSISNAVLKLASLQGCDFVNLSYIPSFDTKQDKSKARDIYFKYLERELGEIQFEGMPTDKDAGSVKVNLESIYTPLRFNRAVKRKSGEEEIKEVSINTILRKSPKSAILAKPGGGKSTLIRRIALAYAYPERRKKVADKLPDEDWFPVYIRCRDLGDFAQKSIFEIIANIVNRAEIESYRLSFEALIEDNLQAGRILLLIDGLDEISNERHRICFVNQLRTFVAVHPTIRLVITSREAGFRTVAGAINGYCSCYSIAGLQEKEIKYLSLKWHQAILDNSVQAKEDSNKVCEVILKDVRIFELAKNPLLLTTLLFVKRWVGYLPTKKNHLYGEMIKLLLVTWNAAAHEKLDIDETEPQLAFAAYQMTTQGKQTVTRNSLLKSIVDARNSLPDILGYTKVSPSAFIDQVEERSSLLIQQGLEQDDNGRWVPSYEFSHLSFQEYLTAKAIAEGWFPDSENQDATEVIKQHTVDEYWKEVVPLAAVLLGRRARPLIEYLINIIESDNKIEDSEEESTIQSTEHDTELAWLGMNAVHLANCIASEVVLNQEVLERAILLTVKNLRKLGNINNTNYISLILKSKYNSIFTQVIDRNLFEEPIDMYKYVSEYTEAWTEVNLHTYENGFDFSDILSLLTDDELKNKISGVLLMMYKSFDNCIPEDNKLNAAHEKFEENAQILTDIFKHISIELSKPDIVSIYSSAWCVAWAGYSEADIIPNELVPGIVTRLTELWVLYSEPYEIERMISWAIVSSCKLNLEKKLFKNIKGLDDAIEKRYLTSRNDKVAQAALSLAALTDYWHKEDIGHKLSENMTIYRNSRFLNDFLTEHGVF